MFYKTLFRIPFESNSNLFSDKFYCFFNRYRYSLHNLIVVSLRYFILNLIMLQVYRRNFGLLKFGKDLVNRDNSLISKEHRILSSIIGNGD